MVAGRSSGRPSAPDPVELLPLVFARPGEALERAHALLDAEPGPGPYEASIAHQVIGIWQRDFGELAVGLGHLRRARDLAARSGSADREADVLATLGTAYVHAGRTRRGLNTLDQGVARGTGVTLARVLFRRSYALWVLGRHREALEDLRRAIPILRRAGDIIWSARALTLRATVNLAMGAAEWAQADFAAAERLWDATDQEHDKAVAVENRGLAAFRAGDLPAALGHFDEAARRYAALGTPAFVLAGSRCGALLAAGLAREAAQEADAATELLDRLGGQTTRRAELMLVAARALNDSGDPEAAATRADAAVRSFSAQRREWWEAHARLVRVQARLAAGQASEALLREAVAVAEGLTGLGSPESVQAFLLAGRTATALGRGADADRHLAVAAKGRWRGPAFARVDGWVAQALLAEAAGRSRGLLDACRRGLELLDEHRMTLGASELRARVTARGAELATLAQRATSGDPRRLLVWSERRRAAALAVPPARPPDDPELQRDLTAFREISSRVEAARSAGSPVPWLRREQERLERDIRARSLRMRSEGTAPDHRVDVRALLAALGDGRLIEIVALDGRLVVLLCGSGRVRAFQAGRVADAAAEAEHARAALRRFAYQGPGGRTTLLEEAGRRLQEILLGPAARHLVGEEPVVVVPPGPLHGVPWALLPALRERVLSVSPSASTWLRARRIEPRGDRVVLVRGPGLATGGAEVPVLADLYGGATVLENGTAAGDAVLKEIDGCRIAHIAAHGTFRADSPMFSSLQMDDGPLIVHDLERLRSAPYRIVLSSCDSGTLEPVGADELLGLATALLPLGTAGIVASSVPVHDEAVVPLMVALHQALRSGRGLAEALRDARATLPSSALHQATGWSFSAIGAA
ncbi:CHAT domain-containing protein [Planotetraspora silvatica]|uniref:CHAT domain-containing protein n=1 Tax=Planotetraspora silvatica TaxID=234614 RepID=UPI00195195CE|nr:CHAT domain-containing tetratricopeptide repeat protein [Planotetraspora silvatica]